MCRKNTVGCLRADTAALGPCFNELPTSVLSRILDPAVDEGTQDRESQDLMGHSPFLYGPQAGKGEGWEYRLTASSSSWSSERMKLESYLWGPQPLNEGHQVKRGILGLQAFHAHFQTLSLCKGTGDEHMRHSTLGKKRLLWDLKVGLHCLCRTGTCRSVPWFWTVKTRSGEASSRLSARLWQYHLVIE